MPFWTKGREGRGLRFLRESRQFTGRGERANTWWTTSCQVTQKPWNRGRTKGQALLDFCLAAISSLCMGLRWCSLPLSRFFFLNPFGRSKILPEILFLNNHLKINISKSIFWGGQTLDPFTFLKRFPVTLYGFESQTPKWLIKVKTKFSA